MNTLSMEARDLREQLNMPWGIQHIEVLDLLVRMAEKIENLERDLDAQAGRLGS